MTFIIIFAVLILAIIGDVVTTHRFLKLGVGERNPLARFVFDKIGFIPGAVLLKSVQIGFLLASGLVGGFDLPLVLGLALCLVAMNIFPILQNCEAIGDANRRARWGTIE